MSVFENKMEEDNYCYDCDGTGYAETGFQNEDGDELVEPCYECDGDGYVEMGYEIDGGDVVETCYECDGKGNMAWDSETYKQRTGIEINEVVKGGN